MMTRLTTSTKKRRFYGLSWNDGFRVMEVNTVAKLCPGGRDVSVFYVMHYMREIIKATKHKQVLITPIQNLYLLN